MKKYSKLVLMLIIFIFCISCNDNFKDRWQKMGYEDYADFTEHDINNLKPPVILIGKSKSMGLWSIVVIDSLKNIRSYGNASYMANGIGASRQIGDTIR